METIIFILSIALLIAIIIVRMNKSDAKKLQLSLTLNFDELRYKTKNLNPYERNKKINQQIENLQKNGKSIESKYYKANQTILLLKRGYRVKDELFKGIQNRNNESISKLTSLLSDFRLVQYELSARYLEAKKHPAFTEAKRIRELKEQSKSYYEQYRQMLYKYEELLQLFPELTDYVDDFETIQQLEKAKTIESFKEDFDRVRFYMSKEEYEQLSINERNQVALDRYLAGRKSNWQIGRDYELYCGRIYERDGWNVEYVGMEQKLQDLGRDLIAKRNSKIHVIQCKYWSQKKFIHEKHINQLYGTAVAYGLDIDSRYKVEPVFITNTQLSDTAIKFADKLGVKVVFQELKDFPRIKCNVNKDSKIYHLPFDQQYDRTQIKEKGEFYAMTVSEAAEKGFRRAFKYYGR
ncbi:restriction endonuclease [Labilibacter sediminis]|nr:restriction endonuclease [Labilibacter sediminis]